MIKFSRDDHRSTASFFVSFIIHFAIILCFALVFFELNVGDHVVLSVSKDDGEELVFESPAAETPDDLSAIERQALETSEVAPQELHPDNVSNTALFEEESFSLGSRLLSDDFADPVLDVTPTRGFFGIEPTGGRVVYVIDMSFSMRVRGYHSVRRYDRAVSEVMKSVEQLKPDQTFYVFLFCFDKIEMNIGQSQGTFCAPTETNKRRLKQWLQSINLGSGTDPRDSLVSALDLNPSCVFLLSDGEFNGVEHRNGPFRNRIDAVQLARTNNQTDCPIHTIGLEDQKNQRDMTLIAEDSGGQYKFISARGGGGD